MKELQRCLNTKLNFARKPVDILNTPFEIAEYCLMYMVMQFDGASKLVPSKPKHNDEIMLQTVLKRLFAPRHLNQGDPLFEYMKINQPNYKNL